MSKMLLIRPLWLVVVVGCICSAFVVGGVAAKPEPSPVNDTAAVQAVEEHFAQAIRLLDVEAYAWTTNAVLFSAAIDAASNLGELKTVLKRRALIDCAERAAKDKAKKRK